jgi:hypothetical protein
MVGDREVGQSSFQLTENAQSAVLAANRPAWQGLPTALRLRNTLSPVGAHNKDAARYASVRSFASPGEPCQDYVIRLTVQTRQR